MIYYSVLHAVQLHGLLSSSVLIEQLNMQNFKDIHDTLQSTTESNININKLICCTIYILTSKGI